VVIHYYLADATAVTFGENYLVQIRGVPVNSGARCRTALIITINRKKR
jgi:hypothetical protein